MIAARRVDALAPVALAAALLALAGAAPAQTAAPAAGAGAIKFGQPGAPIDATANSQQVFQQEHRIVMTGAVEITQGASRLRCPQLTLWYSNNNAVKGAAPGGGPGALERMEAEGPVYFITATQSVKSDHASYLAADDTVTLTGNVVVTQDRNVSTGDKLVIHQKTGQAVLSSERAGGRVRGVFYNEDKAKAAAPGPAAPPAPPPAR